MSYITNDDIALRIGPRAYVQLTDDGNTGSANEAVVTTARLAAESEVNSYLARRYRTPIDIDRHPDLAALLASSALDVAAYRLHARRPPTPGEVLARYHAVLTWLRQVAVGEVILPAAVLPAANAVLGPSAATTGDAAVLSRESLQGL